MMAAADQLDDSTDLDRVDRVIEIVDLVADAEDADPEDIVHATLSRVRRRNYDPTEVTDDDPRQTDS